jgi:hypothetical protein
MTGTEFQKAILKVSLSLDKYARLLGGIKDRTMLSKFKGVCVRISPGVMSANERARG